MYVCVYVWGSRDHTKFVRDHNKITENKGAVVSSVWTIETSLLE